MCEEDKIAYFESEHSKGKHKKTPAEKALADKRKQINYHVQRILAKLQYHLGYNPRESLEGIFAVNHEAQAANNNAPATKNTQPNYKKKQMTNQL